MRCMLWWFVIVSPVAMRSRQQALRLSPLLTLQAFIMPTQWEGVVQVQTS